MPAVALTDHGTMFGAIDFYNAATAAGVKPIIGVETYMASRGMTVRDPQLDKKATHLLLLAENETGYKNLLQIASASQLQGFYYYPRIDHDFLAAHSEGLICTSGCMSAEVPRLLQNGDLEGARKLLDWYYSVFGSERFFLELQSHDIPEIEQLNRNLLTLGPRYNANFVATNDVHYINPEDARLQDIMLAIQTGCLLSDPNRMRMTDPSYYLRTPEEMGRLFGEVPGAINNTLLIAERCQVDLGFKGYHLPNFEVPSKASPEAYLRELCEQGLVRRYGSRAKDPMVRQRLEYELDIIREMGFDTYFLIVWDLCRYAADHDIWYNARGSAAGSIVAYTLDITLVDPIEYGLIFERFLNPGRISMPDIDLDFRDDRRAEVIEYAAQKYGYDKVAQIITFGTLGARAAIRDVGRVMDIPLSEVDRVAKLIPNVPGKPTTIAMALEEVVEFKDVYQNTPFLRELIDTASKMEGVVRNAGTHAAGVIITDKPVIEYIPLHRPTGSSNESPVKMVTQFEMSVLDSLGLLKVDFLGLATLTIMARACELIQQRHGVELNLNNIPTDDPGTYELMGRGDTAGVFQVEGSGMRRWLMQMKPRELSNVIAMVALFRPGPMEFIPGYIKRMHGEEKVDYRHPMLEPIFRETYGYPVYQEQLMFAAMKLAGYTPPESDDLRKAISKKLKDKLLKHRQKFIDGAAKNDIDEHTATLIFEDWEEFARYGFNKSHAADYAVIAVQTAYLKLHYPVEYMTALLSVNKNDTAKIALYVADTRRMGIRVEPPDVNASLWDFSIEDPAEGSPVIRFGLGAVKNVGLAPVEVILKGRESGPFADLNDFSRRVDLRQVGRRALECLIKVGALDGFGSRTAMLDSLDRILSVNNSHFRAVESGQMSLFGAHTGVEEEIALPRDAAQVSKREILNWERELIGLYVSDHPLNPVIKELTQAVTHFSAQLGEAASRDQVRVAGIVTRVRHHQSKAGKPMAFVAIEDLQGVIELVIFPKTWERVSAIVEFDRIILVDGKVDNESGDPKVLVDNIVTEFNMITPLGETGKQNPANEKLQQAAGAESAKPPVKKPLAGESKKPAEENSGKSERREGSAAPEARPMPAADESWMDNMPSDEDLFPANWDDLPGMNHQEPEINIKAPVEVPKEGLPSKAKGENVIAPANPATALQQPVLASSAEIIPESNLVEPEEKPVPEQEFSMDGYAVPDPALSLAMAQNQPAGAKQEQTAGVPLYLVSPLVSPPEEGPIQMITIVLRSSGDKTRDVLRLRRIHGILNSYPGSDRFAIHVSERGRMYLLEFPNLTVGYAPELITRLASLVGQDNVRVEKIIFH